MLGLLVLHTYDNPQVVITVMLEEGREGSSVSVPIAKEILQWYFGGRDQSNDYHTSYTSSHFNGSIFRLKFKTVTLISTLLTRVLIFYIINSELINI